MVPLAGEFLGAYLDMRLTIHLDLMSRHADGRCVELAPETTELVEAPELGPIYLIQCELRFL